MDGRTREAAKGQAAAKALWESLPDGSRVFVEFLGGQPRAARRTERGWESDDGDTRVGCTPWSVRVDEVWVRLPDVRVGQWLEAEATRADAAEAALAAVGVPADQERNEQ